MEDKEFIELMKECGYDISEGFTEAEQQVWNIAKCVWQYQKNKINDINRRIEIFKESFKSL